MNRKGPRWLAALGSALIACARAAPDPASVLPGDAGALLVFSAPARIRESVVSLVDRMPVAAGAVDLVRSVVGMCLDDDAGTRANGLDPSRGPAFALWDDAVLAVLPLDDEERGLRRVRLRLARIGFARDEAGSGGRESFGHVDRDGLRAALWSSPGLAFVCVGDRDRCATDLRGTGWDPRPVAEELAAGDFVAVGVVRNFFLTRIAEALGVPVREPGVGVTLALLQEVRWAVGVGDRVRVRVAAGPTGPPAASGPLVTPMAPGLAAVLHVALPPGVASAVTRQAFGSPAGAGRGPWERWTGELGIGVLAQGGGPTPLPADVIDALRRLRWIAAARFRSPGDAEQVLQAMAVSNSPLPDGSMPAATGTFPWTGPAGIPAGIRVEGDLLVAGAEAGRPVIPGGHASDSSHARIPARMPDSGSRTPDAGGQGQSPGSGTGTGSVTVAVAVPGPRWTRGAGRDDQATSTATPDPGPRMPDSGSRTPDAGGQGQSPGSGTGTGSVTVAVAVPGPRWTRGAGRDDQATSTATPDPGPRMPDSGGQMQWQGTGSATGDSDSDSVRPTLGAGDGGMTTKPRPPRPRTPDPGPRAPEGGSDPSHARIPDVLVPAREPTTILRVAADPGALLDAVGGGRLEFLGHMVRSVRSVAALLTFEAGRLVLTVEARLR